MDYTPILPDLEMTGSRLYAIKIIVVSALLAGMGVWLCGLDSTHNSTPDVADWVLLSIGVLGVALGLWKLLAPPVLHLSQDGFRVQDLWRTRFVAWGDVSGFSVVTVQVRLTKITFVTWTNLSRDQEINPSWHRRRSYDGYLPTGWAIPAHDLCELLQHRLENFRAHDGLTGPAWISDAS